MEQDSGLPGGVTNHDLHEAWGRDCPEDRGLDNETCQGCSRFDECKRKWPHVEDCKCFDCEIEREAKREKKQNVFTPESLKSPMLKNVIKGMDEFDTYEAKQEAGKFGVKNKRRDDI